MSNEFIKMEVKLTQMGDWIKPKKRRRQRKRSRKSKKNSGVDTEKNICVERNSCRSDKEDGFLQDVISTGNVIRKRRRRRHRCKPKRKKVDVIEPLTLLRSSKTSPGSDRGGDHNKCNIVCLEDTAIGGLIALQKNDKTESSVLHESIQSFLQMCTVQVGSADDLRLGDVMYFQQLVLKNGEPTLEYQKAKLFLKMMKPGCSSPTSLLYRIFIRFDERDPSSWSCKEEILSEEPFIVEFSDLNNIRKLTM